MSPVIRVESVSKRYRLGQVGTNSLVDDLNRLWCRLLGKEDPLLKIGQTNDRSKPIDDGNLNGRKKKSLRSVFSMSDYDSRDYVWALKNIDFDVHQGEVLGIIGNNGAGKSTLLKILARVTTPSMGSVKIKGRIASLLEVGTGFHPDLSGRENIYLNGAILGMRKYEISRKLDEIIEFSGCQRYIDTPVKRYSSGMYVRLAFAVAAHLEPEILIVDEVLAVGDAEFQKKCLGKMQDVAKGGRTVLFVSHNMSAIRGFCSRGLLIDHGHISFDGSAAAAIQHYLSSVESPLGSFVASPQANGEPSVTRAQVHSNTDDWSTIQIHLEIDTRMAAEVGVEFRLTDVSGVPVAYAGLGSLNPAEKVQLLSGLNKMVFELESSQLANGRYFIGIDITEPHVKYHQRLDNCLQYEQERPRRLDGCRNFEQAWELGSIQIPIRLTQSTLESQWVEKAKFDGSAR